MLFLRIRRMRLYLRMRVRRRRLRFWIVVLIMIARLCRLVVGLSLLCGIVSGRVGRLGGRLIWRGLMIRTLMRCLMRGAWCRYCWELTASRVNLLFVLRVGCRT